MSLIRTQIFILIISLLLTFCTNNNDKEVIALKSSYSIGDLNFIKLDLLEAEDEIEPLIDSIIGLAINCPNYNNMPLGYIISSSIDTIKGINIKIETINELTRFDYSICNGVFYYKGYQFALIGNNWFLKNTNKVVKLIGINSKSLENIYWDNGEFFNSSWEFVFFNNKFHCISFNNCGEYWFDDKYYVSE